MTQYHFVRDDPKDYSSSAPGHWSDQLNNDDPHDSEPLSDDARYLGETWADVILIDQAGWCGCTDVATIVPLMKSYLSGEWGRFGDTIIQFDHKNPLHQLVANIAAAIDFTEHGGNVGGSWVRPEGFRWLELLERDGYYHD